MSTDTPPRKIHFVTTPGLGQSSITQVQKAAKSHAAREAHAKLRHLRMRKYQERNAESEKASSAGMDDRALIHISCDDVSGAQVPGKNLWKPTLLDSLSSSYRNPFYTIGRPLKEVENFLFHHYMTSVVPQMSIYCPRLALHEGLLPHWRNLLFSDPSLRCIMLLKANRHLQFYHWMDSYSENAMQEAAKYKLLCLQKLRRDIQEEVATLTFSNATIALAFVIALDEMAFGELKVGHSHLEMIIRMVELSGGSKSLAGNQFMHHMYLRLMHGKLIEEYLYDTF